MPLAAGDILTVALVKQSLTGNAVGKIVANDGLESKPFHTARLLLQAVFLVEVVKALARGTSDLAINAAVTALLADADVEIHTIVRKQGGSAVVADCRPGSGLHLVHTRPVLPATVLLQAAVSRRGKQPATELVRRREAQLVAARKR